MSVSPPGPGKKLLLYVSYTLFIICNLKSKPSKRQLSTPVIEPPQRMNHGPDFLPDPPQIGMPALREHRTDRLPATCGCRRARAETPLPLRFVFGGHRRRRRALRLAGYRAAPNASPTLRPRDTVASLTRHRPKLAITIVGGSTHRAGVASPRRQLRKQAFCVSGGRRQLWRG